MNLYFPYAGWVFLFSFFVVAGSNVVLNTHAQLQISLLMRFLSLLQEASQCAFGDGVHWLLVWQFFSLFAQFKTTKSHENYVFLYPFSSMPIFLQNNEKRVFYTGKLYGLTSMWLPKYFKMPLLLALRTADISCHTSVLPASTSMYLQTLHCYLKVYQT